MSQGKIIFFTFIFIQISSPHIYNRLSNTSKIIEILTLYPLSILPENIIKPNVLFSGGIEMVLLVFTSEKKNKKLNFEGLCQIIRKIPVLTFFLVMVQTRKNSMNRCFHGNFTTTSAKFRKSCSKKHSSLKKIRDNLMNVKIFSLVCSVFII